MSQAHLTKSRNRRLIHWSSETWQDSQQEGDLQKHVFVLPLGEMQQM